MAQGRRGRGSRGRGTTLDRYMECKAWLPAGGGLHVWVWRRPGLYVLAVYRENTLVYYTADEEKARRKLAELGLGGACQRSSGLKRTTTSPL